MGTKLEKQIIQRMNGKTTFGQIGKEFGLSCQTIKAIAENNGIQRPKNKSTKKIKEVKTTVKVDGRVSNGAKKAFTERNNLILEMVRNGETYPSVAAKMGITTQRIYEIVKKRGFSKWGEIREANVKLKQNIESDFKAGLSYEELKSKYNKGLTGLPIKFRNKRDVSIVREYKTKTATNVLKCSSKVLNNPNRINTECSVYNIASKSGYKKFPMIGNRSAGGVFEDTKIIEFIKNERDKNNLSFSKIATLLNTNNFKSITGIEFKMMNVRAKYLAIKKHKL